MRCDAARAQFPRYVDGEVDPPARLTVEGHVAECPACAAELAALQRLAQATTEALPELPAPAGFDAAVLAAIDRAPRPRRLFPELPPHLRRWAWGGVAAVMALVTLFTVWVASLPQLLEGRETLLLGQRTLAWNSPASLRVVAYRNRNTREPLAWKPVSLEARRKDGGWWYPLYRGRTNVAGTVDAHFRLPAALEGDCVLRVQAGGLLAQDRMEQRITVERKARVLLSTDKPLYQPGQTLHLRVLAMDTGSGKAAAARPLTLEVKDPKGTVVFRKEPTTSRFGIASADFQLAELVQHGRYEVVARLGNDETVRTVTVKPYVLPKFRVDAKTDRPYYTPGEQLRVAVKSAYFFGQPVAGAKVTVRLVAHDVDSKPFATLHGTTDGKGDLALKTRLPESLAGQPLEQGNPLVQLTTEVTDSTGHQEEVTERVPVSAAPFHVSVVPESGQPVPGLENVFYLVTSYPDGTVARVSGAVVANDRAIPFETDVTGIASVRIPVPESSLKLRIQAADSHGRRVDEPRSWNGPAPDAFAQVLLRTDAAVYQVGQTINAEVLSTQQDATVYVDLARGGQTVLTRSAQLERGRCRFAIDLSDDLTGTLSVHAYVLAGTQGLIRDTRLVLVRGAEQLRVALTPSKEVYRPGEEAKVRVQLTDEQGKPAPGAVGLAAVDESVFALREQHPGLEQEYFQLEESILAPRYEEQFSLPDSFAPSRVLSSPDGEHRAEVTLASLSSGGFVDASLTDVDPEDTLAPSYPLWTRSLGGNSEEVDDFQKGYFRGLSWAVMLLCLLLSTPIIIRRNPLALFVSLPLSLGARWDALSDFDPVWGGAAMVALSGVFFGVALARRVVPLAEVIALLGIAVLLAAILFPCFAKAREAARKGAAPSARAATTGMAVGGVGTYRGGADMDAPAGKPEPPRVREYFPETLFWQPEAITDDRGEVEVTVPPADSITTWRLSAVGSTADGRVGSASTGLRSFQEFFLDLDLPVTLTQHDQVTIPVAVHNYLDTAQSVEVTLKPAEWYRLEGPNTRRVQLAPHAVGVVRFPLTARHFGKHLLEVTGIGSTSSDAMRREIEVLPDGEEVVRTESDRLEGPVSRTVRFPEGTIPGTEQLLLRLQPGALSQVVTGLEGLLQVPHGCMEQSTSATYPNVLILDYLQRTNTAAPEARLKAEQLVNLGYQRLLTFETEGGGFDWFSQPPGKTVLSAYGLMHLVDMARVAPVDPGLIDRTRAMLVRRQQPDGSWKPEGVMFESSSQSMDDRFTATAYVTWALARAGGAVDAVSRGLTFLEDTDTHRLGACSLALAANAFAVGQPQSATTRQLLDELETRKRLENGAVSWKTERSTVLYGGGNAAEVETTALAAQAFLTAGYHLDTATRALTYLVRQKGPQGAWDSTQATILSLQALLAGSAAGEGATGSVVVSVNGRPAATVKVERGNFDVAQQVDLSPYVTGGDNQVRLTVTGSLRPAYQLVTRSYVPRREPSASARSTVDLQVTYDRTEFRQNETVTADVRVRSRHRETLSMLIVDVGLAPGFTPEAESLAALTRSRQIERYEITPRQLILYLRDLPPGAELRLPVRLRAKFPVRAVTPPSEVYEYYHPQNRSATPAGTVGVRA